MTHTTALRPLLLTPRDNRRQLIAIHAVPIGPAHPDRVAYYEIRLAAAAPALIGSGRLLGIALCAPDPHSGVRHYYLHGPRHYAGPLEGRRAPNFTKTSVQVGHSDILAAAAQILVELYHDEVSQ